MSILDKIRMLVGGAAPITVESFQPEILVAVPPEAPAPPSEVAVTAEQLKSLRKAWRDFAVHKQEMERKLPELEFERYALFSKFAALETACDAALVELRHTVGIVDDFGDYELDLDKDPSKGGVFIRDDKEN